MGRFRRGDVLLAKVHIGNRYSSKTRPVIVADVRNDGMLQVYPVSSHPPSDSGYSEVDIFDFAEGGLDLFEESFALTSEPSFLQPGDVIAKKGRLTVEALERIAPMYIRNVRQNR
jgi:mRNA interferase MazF